MSRFIHIINHQVRIVQVSTVCAKVVANYQYALDTLPIVLYEDEADDDADASD